jgi:hypothetical protein
LWYQPGNELWEKVAPFHYELPGFGWVVKNYALSLAALALWFGAMTTLTCITVSRLKIE